MNDTALLILVGNVVLTREIGPDGVRVLKHGFSRRGEADAQEAVHERADRLCLRQGENGTLVGEICRKMGVSESGV